MNQVLSDYISTKISGPLRSLWVTLRPMSDNKTPNMFEVIVCLKKNLSDIFNSFMYLLQASLLLNGQFL